jgi:NAD(P)-dependent dehydrogenase (short-subunit alcohol dehydrogenase family)
MADLSKKTVLVTGGAGGIGLCTARKFLEAGATVIITDINAAALDAAVRELKPLGGKIMRFVCDVSKQTQVEALATKLDKAHGGVDILINNAGIGYTGELFDTSIRKWKQLVDVNLFGPLYHVYAFLPQLARRGGQIVNVSSGQAFFRLPTWGAYAAVKSALGVFSEILRFELRSHGVAVTTVYPFMVDTPFYRDAAPETFMGQLSMKLVPYYSMSPERVARIIFNATRRRQGVERVSLLNEMARYLQVLPVVPDVVAHVATFFLAKRNPPPRA